MTFERVNSFVYLGTLITTDDNISAEINNRITLANRQHRDEDIMKSCIVCMMRLIWLQQLEYSGLEGQDI
jgi:phosphoribosylaminoimidazole-succinocarboxamide synthase